MEYMSILTQGNTLDTRIGKRVRLYEMKDEREPIEHGSEGTIYHIGGGVINVKWDGGRTLGLIDGLDDFEIL